MQYYTAKDVVNVICVTVLEKKIDGCEKKIDGYHKETKSGFSVTARYLSRMNKKLGINMLEDDDVDEILVFDLPVNAAETFWQLDRELQESKKKRENLVSICVCRIVVLKLQLSK